MQRITELFPSRARAINVAFKNVEHSASRMENWNTEMMMTTLSYKTLPLPRQKTLAAILALYLFRLNIGWPPKTAAYRIGAENPALE